MNLGPQQFAAGQKVGQGRFTLVRHLGQGGMGMVWLAQDERLIEPVALKFVPPDVQADRSALEGLRRETARSHKLTHLNIVRIHDLQMAPDEPMFISMEYVAGKTLDELRSENHDGVLSWTMLAPLIKQLCEALDFAHAKGIIHRDLKPSNIMVDAQGILKLADFGIAAAVNNSASQVTSSKGVTSGTMAYMSPQQFLGKTPKVTDDVYALGATLYHLLTSRPPFYQGVVDYQVLHSDPEPIMERLAELDIKNDIPETVTQVVMACLAKKSEDRPQSARELWQRLEQEAIGARASQPAGASEAAPVPQTTAGMDEVMENQRSAKPAFLVAGIFALLALLALGGWYGVKNIPQKSGVDSSVQNGSGTVAKAPAMASKETPWTNSLGMPFMSVPGTKVQFCIWETRVQDYQAYARANPSVNMDWSNPGFDQEPSHPVVNVSWDDAQAFCRWLTEQEQRLGKITGNQSYRLPMDEEWSVAVGLPKEGIGTPADKCGKIRDVYPWGNQWPPPKGSGNYAASLNVGSFDSTAPVGSFRADKNGLFDLSGNVWEWCEDWVDAGQKQRVLRGGSWGNDDSRILISSYRNSFNPGVRRIIYGFRVVLTEGVLGQKATSLSPVIKTTVPQNSVPTTTQKVKSPLLPNDHQLTRAQPWTNGLGMPFVPVPGTKVQFCVWETRVQDFAVFAQDRANNGAWNYQSGAEPYILKSDGFKQRGWDYGWNNPGFTQRPDHPVSCVSWEDAQAFCQWLTKRDQAAGLLEKNQQYRLPTDAEWSQALGLPNEGNGTPKDKDAKIKDVYPWGSQWPPPRGAGNYAGSEAKGGDWPIDCLVIEGFRDGFARTAPEGSFAADKNGLFDLSGNVWEWCEDWYDTDQKNRVLRGGSWFIVDSGRLLSSFRHRITPGLRINDYGFRVVVAGDGAVPASAAVRESQPQNTVVMTIPKAGQPWVVQLGNNVKLDMVWIAPGEFLMGSPESEKDRDGLETLHRVKLTKGFWLGAYEVTQRQYETVMGDNPSKFKESGLDAPVEQVSWDEAISFCKKLTQGDQMTGRLLKGYEYRLPTEAQWEYACRAGTREPYAGSLDEMGWYSQNSGGTTHPVGRKKANAWGLYDMHGNVWEWCWDRDGSYSPGTVVNPEGPLSGLNRVYRSGSWGNGSRGERSANRGRGTPANPYDYLGFRLALVPVQ